jgi:predicted Zn-dependent peptidase
VIHELPGDYYDSYRRNIRAVTVGSVLAAAKSHIHPEKLQTVVVGDASLVRKSLADLDAGAIQVHDA